MQIYIDLILIVNVSFDLKVEILKEHLVRLYKIK